MTRPQCESQPVVGRHKIERAVQLADRHPDTLFVADDARNAHDLNDAAADLPGGLNIVVELCVGRKGGVQPGRPGLAFVPAETRADMVTLPDIPLPGALGVMRERCSPAGRQPC